MRMIIFLTAATLISARVLSAGDTGGLTFGAELEGYNKYFSRGFVNHDSPAIQGSASLGYDGARLTAFADYDSSSGRIYEVDYIAEYSFEAGIFKTGAGYQFYTVDACGSGAGRSQEIFAKAELDAWLTYGLIAVCDVDACRGFYAGLSAGNSWDIAGASLEASVLLDYNAGYWRKGSGFSTLSVSMEFRKGFEESFFAGPVLMAVYALDKKDFRNAFIFGITTGLELK